MANRAYASVWWRGFHGDTMAGLLEKFLETVPFSSTCPGFTSIIIRAVDPGEPPVLELDLRLVLPSSREVAELAGSYLAADTAVEVRALWDLWVFDIETARWQHRPERLEIRCHGGEYDDGVAATAGHFLVDAGFEHLFTGHAGLLGFNGQPHRAPQHPREAEFLAHMSGPENLRLYQEKTRANIRQLTDWIRQAESRLPVDRYLLWSEGEDNFEARLDEILAVR